MLRDMRTLVWKEITEWVGASGKRARATLVIFALVFGVLMPLQWGAGWLTSPVSLLSWAWLPFLLVSSTTADAIAGERERHTLETLLATRLPDAAVFYGKLAAAIVYAVAQLWIAALLAAVTINAAFWSGRVAFYSPSMLAALVVFPVLVAGLAAGLGMLASIRARTARAAAQSMTIALFVLAAPLLAIGLFPNPITRWLESAVGNLDVATVPLVGACALLAVDALVIVLARTRFSRHRLAL